MEKRGYVIIIVVLIVLLIGTASFSYYRYSTDINNLYWDGFKEVSSGWGCRSELQPIIDSKLKAAGFYAPIDWIIFEEGANQRILFYNVFNQTKKFNFNLTPLNTMGFNYDFIKFSKYLENGVTIPPNGTNSIGLDIYIQDGFFYPGTIMAAGDYLLTFAADGTIMGNQTIKINAYSRG